MSAPQLPRFEIVAATLAHRSAVCELAKHLNSVNLPDDDQAIDGILERSQRSFERTLEPVNRREYVFLLRDTESDHALGTSMIIAQLGRRDAPYIYFDVRTEEKYSATLDRHFAHTLLNTTYSYSGPTELGGLVMDPRYRGRPERFGMLISYVRFLFIRMRRSAFRDELLAELLPPFRSDGSSALWEAVGRRFTGLSYREADQLSRQNKEFIRGLFPDSIYATLLDWEAQELIGAVGPQTKAVQRMLSRIGFKYAHRVDPFDGGPHFLASTDQVATVRDSAQLNGELPTTSYLAAAEFDGPPYFRALALGPDTVRPGPYETRVAHLEALLGTSAGATLWTMPLP